MSETVNRIAVVKSIMNGPSPADEAVKMIGAMVAIIESKRGLPAARQLLTEMAKADRP